MPREVTLLQASQTSRSRDKHSRSAIWKYFGYETNEHGKPKDTSKPICKSCYRAVLTKGANTSNLAKHLKDRHPDLYKEFREVGNRSHFNITETLTKMAYNAFTRPATKPTHSQPTLPAVFEQQRKYEANSNEATKLNRAVAVYICMDQVPVYTVEKPGFKQLLEHLNNRYALPSRNFFMHTEIPALYNETKEIVMNRLGRKTFYSCTTDLWTSRATSTFMAVTLQFVTETWDIQTLEEMIQEAWKLDMSYMAGITTDNASANKKAFQQDFTWVPCFGHNLHLAINKGLDIDRVSGSLSRLRKTVSAFSRSPKMLRLLKKKQKDLQLPEHRMIHDEPTCWDSAYEMVERFLEQQQAVCSVLADDRKKWHLMPKDSDITVLETVKEVLSPVSSFTDALSGEKHTTLSAVLPLSWKIFSTLTVEEGDSNLKRQLKDNIREDLRQRYENNTHLQLILNTATFLDPRFKDSFVTLREEVKQNLMVSVNLLEAGGQSQQTSSPDDKQQPAKKNKSDLKRLLTSIQGEKKSEHGEGSSSREEGEGAETEFKNEFSVYEKMPEISAEEDPLTWWRTHETTLPHLAQFAKKYLCISASSSASERVFSTSGLICSARRARLTEEHIDMLVFLAQNLKVAKQL
uniref:BED-type domain-containing protein n=1 Tax=Sinocyclocheilus anshuiensis TaxID=1608454 RepID=A0A671SCA6_9TELE